MTNEEAIERIKEHKIIHKMNEPRAIYISEALDMAIKALSTERKKSKWIPSSDKQYYGYRCSECHKGHWLLPFCPYCGADMRGEE